MFNLKIVCSILIYITLTACATNKTTTKEIARNIQPIELGTITQLKEVATNTTADSFGSRVGINVSSGGRAGVYGTFDVGKIFSVLSNPAKQLELTIKKQNGELVAITQPLGGNFKVGDNVKILLRNGRAVVE
jgi:outer membrane lipoprotein SlyB